MSICFKYVIRRKNLESSSLRRSLEKIRNLSSREGFRNLNINNTTEPMEVLFLDTKMLKQTLNLLLVIWVFSIFFILFRNTNFWLLDFERLSFSELHQNSLSFLLVLAFSFCLGGHFRLRPDYPLVANEPLFRLDRSCRLDVNLQIKNTKLSNYGVQEERRWTFDVLNVL